MLYVRQCDVPTLNTKYGWEFQTKHQLALRMIKQVVSWLRVLGSQAKLLVAFDGAYAAHELVTSLVELSITVISRMRSNAKLFGIPPVRQPGTRGRPRKYGLNRVDLSKRSKHKQGWQSTSYVCRRVAVLRHYKTFWQLQASLMNQSEWSSYDSTMAKQLRNLAPIPTCRSR